LKRTNLAKLGCVALSCSVAGAGGDGRPDYDARVRGLLLGSMIGDALGGPVEFVDIGEFDRADVPFTAWQEGERLPKDLSAYAGETTLMPYSVFRPVPEPYAHWQVDAPAGTLTDDSRHKAFAVAMLNDWARDPGREACTEGDLARAILKHSDAWRRDDTLGPLAREWLGEYLPAANWVLGERDPERALPPSRLWGGLPTCAGQMLLTPIAGVAPGDPEAAYLFAYDIAFIDNSFGRDMNAAIVAGLAQAMATKSDDPEAWDTIKQAMRETDPYGYGRVPWVPRSV